MNTIAQVVDGVAARKAEACMLAGLLLEQARGRDNAGLIRQLTSATRPLSEHRAFEREQEALVDILGALLGAPEPPPTEALWALKVSGHPQSWHILRGFVDRTLAEPALHGTQADVLGALEAEDGPLLREAAELLAERGHSEGVRARARRVLAR